MITIAVLLFTQFIYAFEVNGQLIFSDKSNSSEFVVWVDAKAAQKPIITKTPHTYKMNQFKSKFNPTVMAININDTVIFDNLDHVFHNVFSLDKPNNFDAGMFKRKNEGTEVPPEKKFSTTGKINIFCNIHPSMFARIFVFDHQSYQIPDSAGVFSLKISDKFKKDSIIINIDGPNMQNTKKVEISLKQKGLHKIDMTGEINNEAIHHLRKDGSEYPSSNDGY